MYCSSNAWTRGLPPLYTLHIYIVQIIYCSEELVASLDACAVPAFLTWRCQGSILSLTSRLVSSTRPASPSAGPPFLPSAFSLPSPCVIDDISTRLPRCPEIWSVVKIRTIHIYRVSVGRIWHIYQLGYIHCNRVQLTPTRSSPEQRTSIINMVNT